MLLQVSLSLNIFDCFTYEYTGNPTDIFPGLRVVVPVGSRLATGWVADTHPKFSGRAKSVIGTIEGGAVSEKFLKYARSVSESYFVSLGNILDHSLSPLIRSLGQLYFSHEGRVQKAVSVPFRTINQLASHHPIRFFFKNAETSGAEKEITVAKRSDVPAHRFILSYDRLGVYLDIIRSRLEQNQSVLLVVPDLFTGIFYEQHIEGSDPIHSQIKTSRRHRTWIEYARGKSGIVIGGLLAVMCPISNLGCVISERAGSFLYHKASFNVYNLNHMAGLRAGTFEIPFVEGFSTHTSKSFSCRNQLQVEEIRETRQIKVEVLPLSPGDKGVPDQLLSLMKENYNRNNKILLIVNKKISTRFLFCRKCNRIERCPSCSGMLIVREKDEIRCTRCGFSSHHYRVCDRCGDRLVNIRDMSINSLKETIQRRISEEDVVAVSAEEMNRDNGALEEIKRKGIVISTPVLINPHFRDMFDCIIYLRPETIFSMDEYNTGEMIFSTIWELKEMVKTDGFIYVFSVFHFHYSLKLIQDEEKFFQRELKYRQWFLYPPFYNVYLLEVRSKNLRALGGEMRAIYSAFRENLNIRQIFLKSRSPVRGNFKGKIEIHCHPREVVRSGLLEKKNIGIELVAG